MVVAGGWDTKAQEKANADAAALYESWAKNDVQVEEMYLDDAELVITAYGICGRIARSAVQLLRKEGHKVGFIRPKTISPFPFESFEKLDYGRVKNILDVEMAIPALMAEDVKMAVKGRCPIETCLHSGGEIMSREDVLAAAKKILER